MIDRLVEIDEGPNDPQTLMILSSDLVMLSTFTKVSTDRCILAV